MPELPEAERARSAIERGALLRRIVGGRRPRQLRLPPARAGRDRRCADRARADRRAPPGQGDVGGDLRRRAGARAAPRDGGAHRDRRGALAQRMGSLRRALRGRRHAGPARQAPAGPGAPGARPRRPGARRRRDRARRVPRARGPRQRSAEGAAHGPGGGGRAWATCWPTRSSGARGWIRAAPPASSAPTSWTALRREVRAAMRSALRRGGAHTGDVIAARRRGAACPRCGTEMARATVGGRTTFWCPAEQR